MSAINKYNDYIRHMFERVSFSGVCDFKDKDMMISTHTAYMLDRTQSMFRYEGLPETIPQRILELYLQVNGCCAFYEYEDNLYIFTGGLGGKPDVYYQPTIFTVANPALNFSKNLKIDDDCVIVKNDAMYIGLMPMFNRYATLLAESELTFDIAIKNSRIFDLIVAPDDRTKASAEKYLENVEDGELGVIAESAFLEGLKTQPYGSAGHGNYISQIIEGMQYVKASWFNDLGLNANYNMKREALSSAESQLNNDALLPLIDNMLDCRKTDLEKVNNMFGTNITVELASSWEDNQLEIKLEQKQMETKESEVIKDEETV